MKKLCLLAVGLLFALPLGAAEPVHHAEMHHDQTAAAPDLDAIQTHLRHMDEHIKLMHDQLAKLNAASDPSQRQQLMADCLASMRTGMQMLNAMPACPMRAKAGKMTGGKMADEMMDDCMMMERMGPMMGKAQGAKTAKKDLAMQPGAMCTACHQMMVMRMAMMQTVLEGLVAVQK